jgi:thiamine-monophosphate kinase
MIRKISDIGEFDLIERIRKIIDNAGHKPGLLIHGIGDDAAVFKPEPGYEMVITCDSMVEGRHYLKEYMDPIEIGRRAMVMNISDIGAMGGIPLYALVTLGLTASETVEEIEDIYRGFLQELKPFNASIIGGNITKTAGNTFIDIPL